jgi:NAD(P)-dependent dehydrogenase (short-subunit alcohol dehydrogenase family)
MRLSATGRKAAIRSLVRTWTSDLQDRRIRSNVVSPGPIETPLTNRLPADAVARIVSTIPMGRMGKPGPWMIPVLSQALNYS